MEDDESDFYKFDCNYSKENDFIDINDDKKDSLSLISKEVCEIVIKKEQI